MSELFLQIVNMSISASWLVLAVLLLRLILKKAPRWVNVLLWGIVAIRLICPFSFESALSLIPSAQTISPEIMMDRTPEIHTGVEAINSVVNPIISESFSPDPVASANPLQIWIPVLSVIWIAGIAVLLTYTVVSYWRLRRRVDTAVLYRDNIFRSENVSSPFVLGVLRPGIYLPYKMDGQALEHVVAHEEAHIRRKDHWWKPLGFLLLTLHWFNPLMWLAYILLCRDIELACDEKVIKALGSEQRADYTQALVACSISRRMVAACPLAFGEVGVKERVKSIMNYKKPSFWVVMIAVLACMIVAVCFLTNPKTGEDVVYTDDPSASKQLTLEDVKKLAEKGDALTWEDFEVYAYEDVGSGLYIRQYIIDDRFDVLIGGTSLESEPMYLLLRNRDINAEVDIRTDDVEAFIRTYTTTTGDEESSPVNVPQTPPEQADVNFPELFTAYAQGGQEAETAESVILENQTDALKYCMEQFDTGILEGLTFDSTGVEMEMYHFWCGSRMGGELLENIVETPQQDWQEWSDHIKRLYKLNGYDEAVFDENKPSSRVYVQMLMEREESE